MKWRWQLTTVQEKARQPWSPSELVMVNHCPQLGVSMGLRKSYLKLESLAHLAPPGHLPSSSGLPVVYVPRPSLHL